MKKASGYSSHQILLLALQSAPNTPILSDANQLLTAKCYLIMASLWKLQMLNQLHPRPVRFEHEVAASLVDKGYLTIEGRFGTEQVEFKII